MNFQLKASDVISVHRISGAARHVELDLKGTQSKLEKPNFNNKCSDCSADLRFEPANEYSDDF